jgi:hypothetical protein
LSQEAAKGTTKKPAQKRGEGEEDTTKERERNKNKRGQTQPRNNIETWASKQEASV